MSVQKYPGNRMLGWRPFVDGKVNLYLMASMFLFFFFCPFVLSELRLYFSFLTLAGLQFGPYVWKTYKEVYEEVLQIVSALRASGAEPVSTRICICQKFVI